MELKKTRAKRKYLTYENRKQFYELYRSGMEIKKIAKILGYSVPTIYREITRGETGEIDANGRVEYSPDIAQRTSINRLRHKKPE